MLKYQNIGVNTAFTGKINVRPLDIAIPHTHLCRTFILPNQAKRGSYAALSRASAVSVRGSEAVDATAPTGRGNLRN